MKKFLVNIFIFSVLLSASMLFVFFIADGKSDSYYVRFTTPPQHSLLLGTSRAAQGLQPAVFDSVLYVNKEHRFFNYSFTINDSPFGPAYLESIKKKLNPSVKDGIFILAVDPWSLSTPEKDPNDSTLFRENMGFMGKTKFVNLKYNIPYLVQSFAEPFINIVRKWKSTPDMVLHNDGWLEIDAPMDSASMAKRLDTKLKDYQQNFLPVYKFSTLRQDYLKKTIGWLQEHGTVYLVRLPVHPSMFAIEDELMPDFDEKINVIATNTNVGYFSFKKLENNYQYVDGNHLYKSSGKKVSATIASWISSNNKK
jgi:hypothetical protein